MTIAPPAEEAAKLTPPCPHFGVCGGCQLQHIAYAEQLAGKAAQLRALLETAGRQLPALHLHPSPPLGYRNRIRLSLVEVDGRLRAGYIRAAAQSLAETGLSLSDSIVPITECPIAAPLLWRTAEAMLARLNSEPALWLGNAQQRLDQLELFTDADECGLQFTLSIRSRAKALPDKLTRAFAALCAAVQADIPGVTGAGIALLAPASAERSRRTESSRSGPAWGRPGLTYRVGDISCWVPRGAFFQANRFLLPELLRLVTGGCSGPLAWDLYAGVGLFSRALAGSFAKVVAVEAAEPAATALAATGLRNLHAVQATTLDFLRAAVLQRERPDTVILDPPRTGLGKDVCALLARVAAPQLIYVSCGPQALAADLTLLAAAGYMLAELHLVDLFPQTSHIEAVAVLTR